MKIIKFVWQWLARRRVGIGLFVAIWLVVLCVPQLRVLFSVQTLGSSLGFLDYPWTPRFEGDAFEEETLAEQYPNDLDVLVLQANRDDNKTATRDIDALLRRFPDNEMLLAMRLSHTLAWMKYDRLAGDFSNPNPPPYPTPSPEKSSTPPNFTPQELQQAIDVAQRGRRLEPDNSFYDWALMYFYFAGYRDAEAYRVLEEGSRKPRYDDHSYDEAISAIAAHEKVRPLLWEEKMNLSSEIRFLQFAKSRELARLVSWQMWKAEKRGDHARAIEVRFNFARLCQPMLQGRNPLITGLVGMACRSIIWSGNRQRRVRNNQRPPNISDANWFILRSRKSAQSFANYARTHGRADLVPETMQMGELQGRFHAATTSVFDRQQWYGFPPNLMSRILGLTVLSQVSLIQMVALLSLCFFVGVLTLFSQPAPLQRHDVLTSTLAGAAIAALCAVIALRIVNDAHFISYVTQSPGSQPIKAVSCAAIFALAPLLGSVIVPWGMTLWRMWQQRTELFAPPPVRYEGESARHITRDYLSFALTLCIWTLGIIALGCWIAALVALITNATSWTLPFGSSAGQPPITINEPAPVFTAIAAILMIMLYIGWLIKWRWFAPVKLRPLLHSALIWHRQTLLSYLIVSSLFYLLLSVAALEPRREADARFNDYLQRGEISSLNLK